MYSTSVFIVLLVSVVEAFGNFMSLPVLWGGTWVPTTKDVGPWSKDTEVVSGSGPSLRRKWPTQRTFRTRRDTVLVRGAEGPPYFPPGFTVRHWRLVPGVEVTVPDDLGTGVVPGSDE